jgi:hypothetical protein
MAQPRGHFHYFPEYRIVVCIDCQAAVIPGQWESHLARSHPEVPVDVRRATARRNSSLEELANTPDEIIYPIITSDRVPHLAVHIGGFRCTIQLQIEAKDGGDNNKECGKIYSRLKHIQAHCHMAHGWTNPNRRGRQSVLQQQQQQQQQPRPWRSGVTFQQFFKMGAFQQIFEVEAGREGEEQQIQGGSRVVGPFAGQDVEEHLQPTLQREYERLHTQQRLGSNCIETKTQTLFATSPWMERTRWHETYRGVRRDILLGMTKMPNVHQLTDDYIINRELNVVSSWQDEQRIAALMPVIDDMLDRCSETVRNTSRVLLCWLRSRKPKDCCDKPFTFVAHAQSERRYRQTFKRFFALVFRTYRMPVDVRRGYTAMQFSETQLSRLGGVWEHGALIDDEPMDELRELVFELSVTFCTARITEGQPGKNPLLYFSGILSFSPDAQTFLPAKRFTTHLSALIYVQRLLFLELALPHRAYPHIGIARQSQMGQHERLKTIRLRFTTKGCPSALEEMQSLWNFSRVTRRTEEPSFYLHWSDDGQVVSYGGRFSLTMARYRGLAGYFVGKAEALCDSLMFDVRPDINLASLKDEMVNACYGHSFVQDAQNGLADAYLQLYTTRRGNLFRSGRWDWRAVAKYEKQADALAEMLAGGLHTACGQLPRGTELLGLECSNGWTTRRGIYAWKGSLMYVIRHHKTKRSTNREFNVVRFLPVQLGHSMYKYLVYIRPFLDMLQRERAPSRLVEPSPLLFRGGNALEKPWPSARLTAILKKATGEAWGQPVTSRLFRQLSIGITEKHVKEVHTPFNQYDDQGREADLNVVFAWQSGHRPLQRGTTYGLDGAFPHLMQPALLRAYEWASTRWHEFLHLPSKAMPSKAMPSKAMPSKAMPCAEATVAKRVVTTSLPPLLPEWPRVIISNPPTKRRSPSWHHQDALDTARPTKRRALPGHHDLPRIDDVQPIQRQAQSPGNDTGKPQFVILSEHKLLVCTAKSCQHVVWPKEVRAHCTGKKHRMGSKDAQAMAGQFKHDGCLLQQPDELEIPRFVTSAIPQLPLYTDGLRCEVEPEKCYYICRRENGMRDHCRTEHGWTRFERGGRYSRVQEARARRERPWPWRSATCQRFAVSGERAKFFEVLDSIRNLEAGGSAKERVGNESLASLVHRGGSGVGGRAIGWSIGEVDI